MAVFILIASVAFFCLFTVLLLIPSDRIIRILRDRYPEKWGEVGSPCGYFWVPAESMNWWQRDRITLRLPFWWNRIDWVDQDAETAKLRRVIILVAPFALLSWLAGALAMLALFLEP